MTSHLVPSYSHRILIVKLSAVGDIVHTLPALQTLRNAYPDAYISWAVHNGASGLLSNNPLLNDLIIIPRQLKTIKSFFDVIHTLRKPKFDITIDFQGLSKSGMWSYFTGAKRRIGFRGKESRELNSIFMTERVQVPKDKKNIVDINLSLLKTLGIPEDKYTRTATLYPGERERAYVLDWGKQYSAEQHDYFLIDPFAGWETKTWPFASWAELCKKLFRVTSRSVVILWGPGEEENARKLNELITTMCPDIHPKIAPKTNLLQMVAFIKQFAYAFIGGDTGPMHIAASLGIPTIALFGASCSTRNAPTFQDAKYITIHDTTQPCAGTFNRHCKHGHDIGHCMDTLTPQLVFDKTIAFCESL